MRDADWTPHTLETRPWRQTVRRGPQADRMLNRVTVALPPHVASRNIDLPGDLRASMERATREVTVLDTMHSEELAALSRLLIRTESVASSKIEHIEANVRDYVRALHGIKANAAATSMAAATRALASMIDEVSRTRQITSDTILVAHRALMTDDQAEREYAGRIRDMQNWIGGSDYSPRDALYVPPPPETVPEYMDDLTTFANRSDIPALALAAIAHAQFESIHPFTDGNGRIGRALVNSVLRRRGVTQNVVVPIASAIVVQRDGYFRLLDDYRAGHAVPIIEAFARAATAAAIEAQVTASRLAHIPDDWQQRLGRIRRASATDTMLADLTRNPVITAHDAERLTSAPTSAVYSSLNRLVDAGILIPLTERKRNQIWGAVDILDELDDLNRRIGQRAIRDS